MYYIVVITSVFIAALSQLLLKSSSKDEHENVIREYLNWKVICGYGMMGVSLLMNIFKKVIVGTDFYAFEVFGVSFVLLWTGSRSAVSVI